MSILANGDVSVNQEATDGTSLSSGPQGHFTAGNDFVGVIESVSPAVDAPEPSAIGIFGMGLLRLGLLACRRRRSKALDLSSAI